MVSGASSIDRDTLIRGLSPSLLIGLIRGDTHAPAFKTYQRPPRPLISGAFRGPGSRRELDLRAKGRVPTQLENVRRGGEVWQEGSGWGASSLVAIELDLLA